MAGIVDDFVCFCVFACLRFMGTPVEGLDGMDKYYLSRPEVYYEMWRNWREIHDPYLDKFKLKAGDMGYMGHNRIWGGLWSP